jgi:hypothetical protein
MDKTVLLGSGLGSRISNLVNEALSRGQVTRLRF